MKELFAPKFGRVGTCFWYFNRRPIGKLLYIDIILFFNCFLFNLDLSY